MRTNYSLLKQNDALLVVVHEDLGDEQARGLRTDVGTFVVDHDVAGVIVDISAVQFVDSFMARMLDDVARVARLYGVCPVLVGVSPTVALTLTELGITFKRMKSARTLETAHMLVARFLKAQSPGERHC
jgi:rsbT antagonist protein RsbS